MLGLRRQGQGGRQEPKGRMLTSPCSWVKQARWAPLSPGRRSPGWWRRKGNGLEGPATPGPQVAAAWRAGGCPLRVPAGRGLAAAGGVAAALPRPDTAAATSPAPPPPGTGWRRGRGQRGRGQRGGARRPEPAAGAALTLGWTLRLRGLSAGPRRQQQQQHPPPPLSFFPSAPFSIFPFSSSPVPRPVSRSASSPAGGRSPDPERWRRRPRVHPGSAPR